MRPHRIRAALLCGLALSAGTAAAAAQAGHGHSAAALEPPASAAAGHVSQPPPPMLDQPPSVVPEWIRTITGPPALSPEHPAALYADTAVGMFSAAVKGDPQLVYVPNSGESGMHGMNNSTNPDRNSVTVIDPRSFRIVGHFPVGGLPQHVTPSWDLKTLWADASGGNQLVPINPKTAKPGKPVPVDAPYNLYFTPDGSAALVMAERHNRIDVRDPHTMKLRESINAPCNGVNHADFSADGSYFLVTCEFSGHILKYDTKTFDLIDSIDLGPNSMPQDIRIGPDGRTFYVAALNQGGLIPLEGNSMDAKGMIPTGKGAHGIYPSRDGRLLYVSNRDEGSISVVDPAADKAIAKWRIPHGGSPDMGGVSADGTQLWLSGRDNDEVYCFSTKDGHLLARIRVGANPHGLAFFPQPGRYSLGHTGNFR
ncbi:MAG: YncE family protein [Streptomycetaceae bacterium]|nr:YncE family protein [Streptomycetaceae bacterium]